MALTGTEKGKHIAAQAIAKIGITADPRIAFPGQRVENNNDSKFLVERQTDRQTHRQTHRQTDRQTHKQTDSQQSNIQWTNRQNSIR